MRRFLVLALFLLIAAPFGASLAGCGSKTVTEFCSGGDSGPVVGQVKSILLSPNFATYGESLDYGQIGSGLSASAQDCKGTSVSVRSYTFATSDMSFADINPSNGQVCGGTWNRHSGGGIPDYTTCTAPVNPPATTVAYVTATAEGAVSNAIPVYVHPIVTSVAIGTPVTSYPVTGYTITATTSPTTTQTTFNTLTTPPATGSSIALFGFQTSTFLDNQVVTVASAGTNSFTVASAFGKASTSLVTESGSATPAVGGCTTTNDPSSNCCPAYSQGTVFAAPYQQNSCLSQGATAQITSRVYRNGTTNPADNITCQVGHVNYGAQNGSVFSIDQNGIATAQQPGSTIVTAAISNSGTGGAAGFFATCPPASITLSVPNQATSPVSVNVNNTQPISAVVVDTKGVTLNAVALQYISTSPTTIPGASDVVPTFPGSATITAVCQPPSCNPAPFSQIGLYGTGKPITSNGVQFTAPGTNASVLYIASTQSQYLLPIDFSTGQQGTPLKLTYLPNSMVITQDSGTIYLGSTTALMTVNAVGNSLSSTNVGIPGTVLSVSPDSNTLVVTDPVRQTVSLVSGGTVVSTYGGVGTRAQWSPDSSTVYVTATNNQLLVHSSFTGWYSTTAAHQYADVAVTVPSAGAFFASTDTTTEGRTYCSTSTATTGNPPVETNVYYPVATAITAKSDRITATNDGAHILGATASTSPATLNDIAYSVSTPVTATQPGGPLACTTATGPVTFNTTAAPHVLPGVAATAITGVFPASNSALAFVTYTGTGGVLPLYIPSTTSPAAGTVASVALSSGATAPVNGVFSTDNRTFYVGTSGDNQVHLITVTGTTATDTVTPIAPKLPDANGNIVVPNLLVQRPKKSTS